MAVNAFPGHSHLVHVLVLPCCLPQQTQFLLSLKKKMLTFVKDPRRKSKMLINKQAGYNIS